MTVRERVVRGSIASEHIVQFFDTDESRAECVAAFLAEGYRQGEPAIVVARPGNWAGTVARLEDHGIPVARAIKDGKIVVRDAADTLRRLSRNSVPDAGAFEAVVGNTVAELSRGGRRVRAYGEMVDMLAQRGDMADAITLETMWNGLGERTPFSLLCGYSAAHFVASGTHRALRQICAAHTSVHRHAQDPLADWLLKSAHDATRSTHATH